MKMNRKNNKDFRQHTLDFKLVSCRSSLVARKFESRLTRNKSLVFCLVSCVFGLFLFSGCDSGKRIEQLKTQNENLEEEKVQLTSQIEQFTSDNNELKKRIQVLQNLPEDVKAENLYQLQNVKIHNYSDIFDDDENGKLDTLIVRVQPYDNFGDLIKAAGTIEVELWNLNNSDSQAKLAQWKVEQDKLKEKWVEAWGVTNYRLPFDISDIIESFDTPLTIKMTFTDYLSGKVFQDQAVIEP